MLARQPNSRASHGSAGGRQPDATPVLNDDEAPVLNDDEAPVLVGDA